MASRSEVYFRQDHPIVKRTEIYSRSVQRERGGEAEERRNIKSSALSRHHALGSSSRAESATE